MKSSGTPGKVMHGIVKKSGEKKSLSDKDVQRIADVVIASVTEVISRELRCILHQQLADNC